VNDGFATTYYQKRWREEQKANAWAMHRAARILSELSALGVTNPRMLRSCMNHCLRVLCSQDWNINTFHNG